MNPRRQVLEAELKTVQTIRLSHNPAVVSAAKEREQELLAELDQETISPAQSERKRSEN